MKKILITGAGGFFATRFIDFYKDKYEIIPFRRTQLDVTDKEKVMQTIKSYNPDYVIHTAAIADTQVCKNNPDRAYNINVNGSVNVAEASKEVNAKLIYFSSEQVYNGNSEKGPYDENVIPKPNTVYGKNKLEAEKKISQIMNEVWFLRFTWLFGFPERNKKVNANIVMNVMRALLKNQKTKFSANEYRGMTYVYNIIENFEKILDIPYGVYNVGSENNLSTYDIACIVLKELGLEYRKDEILEKDVEKYSECDRDLRITNKKLRDLGIEFMTTEEGIKKCIKDFNYRF